MPIQVGDSIQVGILLNRLTNVYNLLKAFQSQADPLVQQFNALSAAKKAALSVALTGQGVDPLSVQTLIDNFQAASSWITANMPNIQTRGV